MGILYTSELVNVFFSESDNPRAPLSHLTILANLCVHNAIFSYVCLLFAHSISYFPLYFSDDLLVCRPIVFDKDNEEEGHVDFISAAANLRAVMYGLPVTGRYEVKRIAGRIIPAIATTTATVAGLVSLEVLKYICFSGDGDNSASKECLANEARNNFINLSLPSVLSVRPGLCDATKLPNGEVFTIWDRWDYKLPSRSTTMQDFIDDLKVKHRLDVSLITKGSDPVFISMMQPYMSRLKNPFVQELKVLPEDKYVDLVVIFEGGDGADEDVAGPPFRVILPQDEYNSVN